MSREPKNEEEVNDRAKLLMHRMILPYLRRHPELVLEALKSVQKLKSSGVNQDYLDAWETLLQSPFDHVLHRLIQRDQEVVWLRVASPFTRMAFMEDLGLRDVQTRHRLWRKARLGTINLAEQQNGQQRKL